MSNPSTGTEAAVPTDLRPFETKPEPVILSPEEIVERVKAEALRLGEDPRAILREVETGTPTGRFILKLMGLRPKMKRRGRPRDLTKLKLICRVVDDLRWDDKSKSEAIKAAPAILAKMGLCGTTRERAPLTVKRVREAYENRAAIWFEPLPMDDVQNVN